MADFKGSPLPKYHSGFCTSLKDDISAEHEDTVGESTIVVLLHDMIGDGLVGMSPFQVDFHHFATVSRDTRFTYWLWYCLNRFEGRLKMA